MTQKKNNTHHCKTIHLSLRSESKITIISHFSRGMTCAPLQFFFISMLSSNIDKIRNNSRKSANYFESELEIHKHFSI